MRYLRKSMALGIRQTWVRTLAQPHLLCGLGFILVPLLKVLLPAFIPSTLPTTHFPLLLDYFRRHKYHPKQTSASALLVPFSFHPMFLLLSLPSFSKESPAFTVSSSAIPTHSSTLDGLSSAPTSLSCSVKVSLTPVCCWLQQTLLCPLIIWLLSSIFNSWTLLPARNTLLPWYPSRPFSRLLRPLSHTALVGLLVPSPLPGIEYWGP